MLYATYQLTCDVSAPVRLMAAAARSILGRPWPFLPENPLVRAAAACEIAARAGLSHARPDFRIEETVVAGRRVGVREEVLATHPFCDLLHFAKDGAAGQQPRVLLVAPMSGHFATLLRGTVEALLPDHDVLVTDWANARDVPLRLGGFDLDDFVDLIGAFLRFLGPGTHVVAVCQPSVPVLAAAALMAQDNDPDQPASVTLIGGPIDPRVNPTRVNELATSRPLAWFERTLIKTVPARYPGAFRRVYPGFLQLAGFMAMNLDRHVAAQFDLFDHLVRGDGDGAAAHRAFYDEYLAVMDLPAEFYLQTIGRVFQEHALPRHAFESRGRKVDPRAVERIALLTVEGEEDDICAAGQTAAAHGLCRGIPDHRRAHHLQPGVGHYGVFNGRRWRREIYPAVRGFIRANDRPTGRRGGALSAGPCIGQPRVGCRRTRTPPPSYTHREACPMGGGLPGPYPASVGRGELDLSTHPTDNRI